MDLLVTLSQRQRLEGFLVELAAQSVEQESYFDEETGEYVEPDVEVVEVEFSGELTDSEQYSYQFRDGDLWTSTVGDDGNRVEQAMSEALSGSALEQHQAAMSAFTDGHSEFQQEARWSPADLSSSRLMIACTSVGSLAKARLLPSTQ